MAILEQPDIPYMRQGDGRSHRTAKVWYDGSLVDPREPIFHTGDLIASQFASVSMYFVAYGCCALEIDLYEEKFSRQFSLARLAKPSFLNAGFLFDAIQTLLRHNRMNGLVILRVSAFMQLRYPSDGNEESVTALLIEPLAYKGHAYPTTPALSLTIGNKYDARPLENWRGVRSISDPLAWRFRQYSEKLMTKHPIMRNSEGRIAQPFERTIYLISRTPKEDGSEGFTLATPPISEGVVYDPIRELVAELAPMLRMSFQKEERIDGRTKVKMITEPIQGITERPIEVNELKLRDREVFLASTRYGIESVGNVANVRKSPSQISQQLRVALNKRLFPMRPPKAR